MEYFRTNIAKVHYLYNLHGVDTKSTSVHWWRGVWEAYFTHASQMISQQNPHLTGVLADGAMKNGTFHDFDYDTWIEGDGVPDKTKRARDKALVAWERWRSQETCDCH